MALNLRNLDLCDVGDLEELDIISLLIVLRAFDHICMEKARYKFLIIIINY